MAEGRPFVGRKAELERFEEFLLDRAGQMAIVVGQAGMGKTWLVERMAAFAQEHSDLNCGCVRYELTSNDSPDVVMERMMDDAFRAGQVVEGSFDNTAKRREQWYALLKTMIPKGKDIAELIKSFERNQQRPTREEFLDRLRMISAKMGDAGRAVFVLDPLEYLDKEEDKYAEEWAVVAGGLPEKIKIVFAQRPEDVLVRYRKFAQRGNVVRIPQGDLGRLDEEAVGELLDLRAPETKQSRAQLDDMAGRYEGHPYALQGALDLLANGATAEELTDDPTETGVVKEQWGKICAAGHDAIHLFRAYAILEVAVPDDVVDNVSQVHGDVRLALLAGSAFLQRLLHGEGASKRIYHLLLAQYILGQMTKDERSEYHARAVEVYRGKLQEARENQTRPDELAATRLAEHVLAGEGEQAFVNALADECYSPLDSLGLLDTIIRLSELSLSFVEEGCKEQAVTLGNVGLVYRTRGDLDKAEEMHLKSLEIEKKLGRPEGMANQYGNLGVVYYTRGDLDKAEAMYQKSLELNEKLGRPEGMASNYGNLGLVYRTRGDLDKAEEMHLKSLEIEKKLGRPEGMASNYGNLGGVYLTRGDLDKAEEMHLKSLEIHKKLGRAAGMANQYAGLGLVSLTRGDLDKAEVMLLESLELDEKVGRPEGMASQYGNLGLVYLTRGDLEKAEEMHLKSLEIEKNLGRPEGMANQYGNLGGVYLTRGDLDKAREYWEKSVALYRQIGMPHMVKKVQALIDDLAE